MADLIQEYEAFLAYRDKLYVRWEAINERIKRNTVKKNVHDAMEEYDIHFYDMEEDMLLDMDKDVMQQVLDVIKPDENKDREIIRYFTQIVRCLPWDDETDRHFFQLRNQYDLEIEEEEIQEAKRKKRKLKNKIEPIWKEHNRKGCQDAATMAVELLEWLKQKATEKFQKEVVKQE